MARPMAKEMGMARMANSSRSISLKTIVMVIVRMWITEGRRVFLRAKWPRARRCIRLSNGIEIA